MKSRFLPDQQDPFNGDFDPADAGFNSGFMPFAAGSYAHGGSHGVPPTAPPALTGEAISSMTAFTGTAETVVVSSLGVGVANANGFNINLEFDAAAAAAPAFMSGIEQAAMILGQTITNKITANLQINYSGTGGGASAGPDSGQFVNYSTVRADLIANAAPGDTTFNALPTGSTIGGQSQVVVWNAQLKLWGLLTPNDTTTDDGSATFATDINPSLLVGAALHELTHALGRVPYGSPPDVFDFYRFTSPGTYLFNGNIPAPAAYFSLNGGVTKIADYGQNSDPSDFLNSGVQGSNDPFNEIYSSSTIQTLTAIDKEELDALGFNTMTVSQSTAPTVSSIVASTAGPTNAASITETVTFSEAVSGVNAGDFSLGGTLAGDSITGVTTVNASTYQVTVATGSGNGTVQLNLNANDSNISDSTGNTASAAFTSGTVTTVQHTAPTVSSIVASTAGPTNAASITETVTFSEAVSGVNAGDFSLGGTLAGDSITGVTTVNASTYPVTVATGTGIGTVQINLKATDSGISDSAGNTASAAFTSGTVTTVQHTALTVSSIVASTAGPTNAASITETVTFSEAVSGVNAGDFSLGGTLAGDSITGVTGSGTAWQVTVATGSGNGTVQLNLKASDSDISDAAGNTASAAFTSGTVTAVQHTALTVSSIVASTAGPTNAASITETVTFSEAVSGVNAGDFSLGGTLAGDSITGVTTVNASTYQVTVATGSGNGTVQLNLKAGDSNISDAAGNTASAAFTSGTVTTVQHTAPTVSSIVASTAGPTNAASITETVTFSEAVSGVNAGDFSLGGPLAGDSITGVTAVNASTYQVTVATGSGNGTVQLNLNANDSNISDAAGNTASAAFTSGTVTTVQHSAPTVSSIVASTAGPTNAASITETVTFSEAVSGVNAGDFALGGTLAGDSITGVTTGNASTYQVTVATGSGNGTVQLNLNANDSNISDSTGNTASAAFTSGTVTTVQHTAPTVSSIVASTAGPTNAASITETVTFSEAVSGVNAGDFSLGGTLAGDSITGVTTVNASTYQVTVATGSGNGTVQLNLNANDSGITDSAGNTASAAFTSGTVTTVQHTAPAVSSIVASTAGPTNAASITETVTFSEVVSGVNAGDFALGGTLVGDSITGVTGSGTAWQVTVATGSGNGTVQLNLNANDSNISDAAGNTASAAFTSGTVTTVQHTAPTVSSIVASTAGPTNAASITETVTFSEAVSGVNAGDFSLGGTLAGDSITGVTTVNASTYQVTVATGSGNGTVQLNLNANDSNITDSAGNTASAAFTSGTVTTVQHAAPAVSSIVASTAGPTNAASITETVTFSEAVSGVNAGDFSLGGTLAGDSITGVTGSGTAWQVTVATGSGNGTVQLNLNANDSGITDSAGNTASAAFTSGTVTTVQHTTLTVSSIVASTAGPTNAASITETVTFSEAVSGVNAGDFSLGGTLAGDSITGVTTVNASTYQVTVATGSGNGTVQLNLNANDSGISDAAGNYAIAAFTSGTVTKVQHTAPTAPTETNTQLVTELYVGYYDRAPDPAGLNAWLNALNAGVSLQTIANDFANSVESTSSYPFLLAPSAAGYSAFITSVYENILNRATDTAGAAFWLNQLQTGHTTPGGFILAIEDSVNLQSGTPDALTLENKTTVGLDYVTQLSDANLPFTEATSHAVLSFVTSDPASVGTAEAVTAAVISAGSALDYIPAGLIVDGSDLVHPGFWGVPSSGVGGSIPALSTSANQFEITNFTPGTGSNANILLFPVLAWTPGSIDAGLTYGDGHTVISGPTVIETLAPAATLSASANVFEIAGPNFANAAALATALSTSYGLIFAGTGVAAGKDAHMLFLYNDASGNAHIADVDFENAPNTAAATSTAAIGHIVASDMVELLGVSATGFAANNIHLV